MANKIPVTLDEQETTINLFPKQVSDRADVYSCVPAMMAKLRKLAESFPDDVRIEKEDQIGLFASVPQSWVTIRKPRQMNYTEEQKQVMRERLAKAMNRA